MEKLQLKNSPVDEKKKYINLFRLSVNNPKYHRNTPDEIFFIEPYTYLSKNAIPFIFLRFNNENKVLYGNPTEIHKDILPEVQQYLVSKGYKPSDITGFKSQDEYIDDYFIKSGLYLDLFDTDVMIKGRYYIVDVPVIRQKCVIFGFWFMNQYPMELTNEIVYEICKEKHLFDRLIYIANGSKPLIQYNDFNPGPSEDDIEDNSSQHAIHLMNYKDKRDALSDFRKNRDSLLGKKLTMSNGKEMPMAQYNALKYVDEGTVNKSKRIIYMTEEQINHIKKELLNEITIYDKYGIEKKNGKTNLDFATYSKICTLDPTSIVVNNQRQAGKFCNWLLQRFDPERLSDTQYCRQVRNALEQYGDGIKKGILKRYGVNTDIGSFKTIDALLDTMKSVMGSNTTDVSMSISNAMEKLKGQYEIIGENPNWYIVIPKTFEAERFFGSHTEWCTVANSDYFNSYTRRGPLYITFPKNGDNKLKMQFHFPSDSFGTYEDEVYRNPKACIYNVLGDGEEFNEVCAMWEKVSASFKKYTFVKNSEVPGLLAQGKKPEEIFDWIDGKSYDELHCVGLNNKYNLINTKGELLSPNLWFGNVWDFSDGYARVILNDKYNFINTNGELLWKKPVNQWFDSVCNFYNGYAQVALNGDRYKLRKDGVLCDFYTKEPLATQQMVSETKKIKRIYLTESQVEEIKKKIQQARKETNTNPTEGQKEAGNYKMGRVSVLGYEIAIENPKGSIRSGKNKEGKEWHIRMNNDYGYFTHTLGYDGDAIDVFLGSHFDTYSIFAIDQKNAEGEFDETKIMLGFRNEQEAKDAYMSNYEKGWKGFWKITEVPHTVFQKWLYDGYKQKKPFFEYAEIQKEKLNENVDFYKKNKFKMSGENISDFAHVISETFDEIISQYEGDGETTKVLTKESIAEIVDNNELQDVITSFDVQKQLNPKFWVNGKLNSRVRLRLLDIADTFFDSLDVSWVKPKDIIMTGSLANYNWSKYSDIDLHIVVNFKDVDERVDFVKNYFDSKKKLWNEEHEDLTIYGYPVELYVQDANEEHTASGIYSLEKDKWIKEPERDDLAAIKLDKETVVNKTKKIADKIEDLETACETEKDTEKLDILSNKVKKLFDRIKGMRKEGLKTGELGTGNLIFKCLRRLGYIGRLVDLKRVTFDKINSIK